jgi:hypothetical protein
VSRATKVDLIQISNQLCYTYGESQRTRTCILMCDGYVALLQGLHTALETLSDSLIYLHISRSVLAWLCILNRFLQSSLIPWLYLY